MKQLVFLSGKGGTGKTSVAASFAHLTSMCEYAESLIMVDADVDAANLELVFQPKLIKEQDFIGGKIAVIKHEHCISCGDCQLVCRFDAINYSEEFYSVDVIACDGCAACVYQCPVDCITMQEQTAGKIFISEGRYGPLYHANLFPGQDNSGKLVSFVRQLAKQKALEEDFDLIFIDGPPGIGCPVISAITNTDLMLIITEPTKAGVHDMRRVFQTGQHFGVKPLVCINKFDIYPTGVKEIESFCYDNGIEIVGRIPFDSTVTEAMVQGEPVTEYQPDSPASKAIKNIWIEVLDILLLQQVKSGLLSIESK